MDNNSTTEEHSNKRRESTEIKIEDKIYNMLDEVMEEKDSNDSFQYDCGKIDDEYKFSRPSTRRCTNQNPNESNLNLSNNMTQFLSFPSFNRNFKRNMTHHLNQVSHPHFNQNKNQSIQMPRKSAQFSVFDFNSLNSFAPNYYNNSFNSNNLFQYNNNLNLNLSMQSLNSANPQFNESFINNNNLIGNNYYNENFNGQNNFFRPNLMTNLNNNDVNCINNVPLINNINSNINMNNTNNDFKRKENRKKTHDVQNNFQKKKYVNDYLNNNNFNYNNNNSRYLFRKSMSINNNINNNNLYLKNIIMNNSINNNDIINNMNSENTNSFFNTNNTNINNNLNNLNNLNNNNNINDNLIFELKHLLEHTGKIDFYIYNLIKGKIVSIIKNHKGSKIFQKYLKSTHSDEILHLIFIELLPFLVDLIIDPYANYFCKKFFTFLNAKDRIDFLKNIEKALIELSSDSIGTYPIQSIIEHLNTNNEKNIFLAGIKEGYVKLIYDAFGCHVLEKLLTCFEDEYVDFIYTYIFDNFLYLTNNSNGIYIIKKILTFVQKKNLHEKLKSIVKKNAIFLIKQSYGNFVIQVIIENWEDYKEITDLFEGNFFALSLEKYASNVIERCIEKDKEILENYINEIIENKCISNVMKSNYGNYVVQKVIKLAEGENKKKFVFNAAKDIDKINDNKLIQKWKSLLSPHINELDKEQIDILKEQKYFS